MNVEFPKVNPTDPSDVVSAIETAQVLWRNGDLQESLRWVRRAAEAAETEGDDMRALALARAAADLQEQYHPSDAPPPVSSAPPRSGPPPLRAAPPRSAPPPVRSAPPSRAPAPPERAAERSVPAAPKLEPWAPPSSRPAASAPPPPSARRSEAPRRSAPPNEQTTPVAPLAAEDQASADPDTRAAVRVAIEGRSNDGAGVVVRFLGPGAKPTKGEIEALLVPLSAGVDLREV